MAGTTHDARDEQTFKVYWCPICEVQCDRPWHPVGRAGLIPQAQDEHSCDRIETVRRSALDALCGEVEKLEAAAETRERHISLLHDSVIEPLRRSETEKHRQVQRVQADNERLREVEKAARAVVVLEYDQRIDAEQNLELRKRAEELRDALGHVELLPRDWLIQPPASPAPGETT